MGSCWSKKNAEGSLSGNSHVHRSLRKSDFGQYEPKVLILGVAGLACAVELKNNGLNNVRIVEMSDRIGGRVKTMKFADNYIDLGAQWVYGESENLVWQMADADELGKSDGTITNMNWIRSNGKKISQGVVDQILKLITTIYDNMQDDAIDPTITFGDYLSKMFDREVEKQNIRIDKKLAKEFIVTFKKMEGNMADTDMSAYDYWSFKPCDGSGLLNWRDKGFKQFLRHLVHGDDLNEHGVLKDCIDLNQRVRQVEWDRPDGTVLVSCEKEKYSADQVVITVSLGVLKHSSTLFRPSLPDAHCKAINSMGFGNVCKIFVEFQEKFWPDDWRGFNALWREQDMPAQPWLKDIYGFHVYDHQPRVLLGWACGFHVEGIETMKHSALVEGVVHMLQHFLPNFQVLRPNNLVISKWGADPAHYGSYSYPSALATENDTGPEKLAQPIHVQVAVSREPSEMSISSTTQARPVLFFAGEATSSDHYSTVHGAIESGIREAERIISFYRSSTYSVHSNSKLR
ncbi:spermine oxidase isoform X1 [Drosophila mojavensis]|uniref:Amine oxidase domain-containing protein n=1 Tax=Drosophila mojavensis TaxID=7230 RepID=B4KRM4_DROMO|nr:spermine oxidase isoform X1 [Drosophila mojavensis]EDW08294.2 uncharacterized protein Dmoj_GI19893 [Drosophila mojavensis]